MTTTELSKEFILDCKVRNLAPKTIRNYEKQLSYFLRYLKEKQGVKDLEELKPVHIKQFIVMLQEKKNKPSYVNNLLEGNLGIRISDIVRLRLCDIVNDSGRYRLSITEQKTGKQRVFTVPLVIYQYIENYCLRNGIARDALMFPVTTRAIQKQLALVCEYLGYEGISTHSFRKWYATEIYQKNGYDIALVQRLLQHSSAAITQRYIGIEPQRIEKAIEGHAELI